MIRGGGYNSENKRLRSAARDAKGASATDAFLGIRVVLVPIDE
jgi:formylglycine-generating enzyme required for sulfatase activity